MICCHITATVPSHTKDYQLSLQSFMKNFFTNPVLRIWFKSQAELENLHRKKNLICQWRPGSYSFSRESEDEGSQSWVLWGIKIHGRYQLGYIMPRDNSFTLRFNLSRLAPFVFKCKNAFTWELQSSSGTLGQLDQHQLLGWLVPGGRDVKIIIRLFGGHDT